MRSRLPALLLVLSLGAPVVFQRDAAGCNTGNKLNDQLAVRVGALA